MKRSQRHSVRRGIRGIISDCISQIKFKFSQKRLVGKTQNKNIECVIGERQVVRRSNNYCTRVCIEQLCVIFRGNGARRRKHYKEKSHGHDGHIYRKLTLPA